MSRSSAQQLSQPTSKSRARSTKVVPLRSLASVSGSNTDESTGPSGRIDQFRGALEGRTVVVLGAGGLDYLRPRALQAFPVISVNSSARKWGLRPWAVVVKEHVEEAVPNAAAFPGVPIICSAGPYGNSERPTPPDLPDLYIYEHLTNKAGDFDAIRDWPANPDQLVVSMSTMTTAMHFAAYCGAAIIVVVGLVCGLLEGKTHFAGYGHPADPDGDQPPWMSDWLARSERQALAVKRELVRRYDVEIVGLTPWISPELDGLTYRSPSNAINAW